MYLYFMKIKYFIFTIIISNLLLSSCTVEKRLHNKGYYVEWRSFPKTGVQKQTEGKLEKDTRELSKESELSHLELASQANPNPQRDNLEKSGLATGVQSEKNLNTIAHSEFQEVKTPFKQKNSSGVQHKSKKPNPSFIKKLTVLNKKQVLKVRGKESNKLAFVGLGLTLSSLILFVLVIPAIFVNAAALRQINHEPNRYNNKSMAMVSYVISVMLLALAFVIFSALLFLFTFEIMTLIWIISVFLSLLVSSMVIINV